MSMNTLLQKKHDLQQERATRLDTAAKAYETGNMPSYNEEMGKVKDLNKSLENLENLIIETSKKFPDPQDVERQEKDKKLAAKCGIALADTIRKGGEYMDAWMQAMRKGVMYDKGRSMDDLKPLYEADKALSISGGTVTGEDGGFLVPLDFETRVITLAKDYVDLSTLVNVETVSVNSGWRPIEAARGRKPLPQVDELGTIGKDEQPKYSKINFSCKKYGDRLEISNELMADSTSLMAYLAGWWAPKFVLTKNSLILSLLNALEFSALTGATDAAKVKAIKSVLNKELITAHSKRAILLTNGEGYDIMDNWVDANNRGLLQPDLSGGDFSRFKGRPVHYADISDIPMHEVTTGSESSQTTKEYAPIYVGDFKSFATLFLRQGIRMRATDIGGNAWASDSYEIRATCRMDCKTVDGDAVKFKGIEVS